MNCFIAEQHIQVSVLLQNKPTSKAAVKPVFLLLQFVLEYYVSLFSEFIRLKDCLNFSPSSDSGSISLV